MLIGPLVFSTLVVGIAYMGDAASVGGCLKAMLWFVTASLVSLVLGPGAANWLQPGHNLARCRVRRGRGHQPGDQVHAQGVRQPPGS